MKELEEEGVGRKREHSDPGVFVIMNQFDYKKVFKTARAFAEQYSQEIMVQEDTRETVFLNGEQYPCVPLKFYSKGNSALYEKLLNTGCCTKMDGSVEEGKRIRRVLLWIEQDCESVHYQNRDIERI